MNTTKVVTGVARDLVNPKTPLAAFTGIIIMLLVLVGFAIWIMVQINYSSNEAIRNNTGVLYEIKGILQSK